MYYEDAYVPWKTFFWHIEKLATMLEYRSSFIHLRVNILMKTQIQT